MPSPPLRISVENSELIAAFTLRKWAKVGGGAGGFARVVGRGELTGLRRGMVFSGTCKFAATAHLLHAVQAGRLEC